MMLVQVPITITWTIVIVTITYYYYPRPAGRGFESCCCLGIHYWCSEVWGICLTPHCLSSLSCINKYLAMDRGWYGKEKSSRSNCNVAEMLLNASKRNWFGVAMNSSATRGWSVKYFEWSLWQDTALYKNLPFSVEGGIVTGHSVV